MGEWSGTVAWTALTRAGGVVTPLISANQALSLVIAETGALTGAGYGCAFAGLLANTGTGSALGGRVLATGCTNAAHNGTYATKALPRNAGDLEFQLERQFDSGGGGQTTVTLKGIASKV